MTEPVYVELHAASAFSFLDGASQPEALIERAANRHARHCAGRSKWTLWSSALPHGGETLKVKAHIGAEIAVSASATGSRRLLGCRIKHQPNRRA